MLRSMTAYGRSRCKTAMGTWILEIQSVNRRMLDINVSLPKELQRFENDIRKWIAEEVQRGQISLRVSCEDEKSLLPDVQQFAEIKKHWEKVARDLGYDVSQVTLDFLTRQLYSIPAGLALKGKEEELKTALQEGIQLVLTDLNHMKDREGAALYHDIRGRLKTLQHAIEKIEKRAPFAIDRYKEKLALRLKEFSEEGKDERILREVVIFAEKIDISEELTRLQSHIDQFHLLIDKKEKSIGRSLDFLMQEINREINTLSAKSADMEITMVAVEMKTEAEKIREQIQNVE